MSKNYIKLIYKWQVSEILKAIAETEAEDFTSDEEIEEIKKGITEADAGDFASDEEVKATFTRLTNAY